MVKIKVSKFFKKYFRCFVDGNELFRFYGTIVVCFLGFEGLSSLCVSGKCCVCRVIRYGFFIKNEVKGKIGVFTILTSGRAFESIEEGYEED